MTKHKLYVNPSKSRKIIQKLKADEDFNITIILSVGESDKIQFKRKFSNHKEILAMKIDFYRVTKTRGGFDRKIPANEASKKEK